MSPRKPPHETMTFTGTFIGSAVGKNNEVKNTAINAGDVQAQASVDDLRAAIAAARDELIGAAGPEASTEVDRRLGQIEDELAEEEPEGPVVRSRWRQVVAMLEPLANASEHIARITDLIAKVFTPS